MKIIGAGMAGLIAANMLRKKEPVIYEKQDALPHNHKALLRHRTDKIAAATGIPFKKVKAYKSIFSANDLCHHHVCSPKHANQYSQKVTGEILPRSILNLDTVERFISPEDFIEKLSIGINIKFGEEYKLTMRDSGAKPVVSTMPLPLLLKNLNISEEFEKKFPGVNFSYSANSTVNAKINLPCDIHQTIYIPEQTIHYYDDPIKSKWGTHLTACYRISITGGKLIAEFIGDGIIDKNNIEGFIDYILYNILGIDSEISNVEINRSNFGKIKPLDKKTSRKICHYLTKEFNIYSLGRFATWRNVLLDDIVDDVITIEELINLNN